MQLRDLVDQTYKRPNLGAAHLRARDAYKDVPILKPPTWNNEVAAYFFFGGISAGAGLIGSLADLFGGERRKELARTANYVSFVALLPCPPLLIADLGTPSHFHHMLRVFKPSSPMNLGSWALLTNGAVATLTVTCMLAQEGKVPVIGRLLRLLPGPLLAGLGIPTSLLQAGYTGVLLGTTSIPLWYTSPLLGALFMSSSLTTGAAATDLVSTLARRDSREDHHALASLGLTLGAAEAALLAGYVATSGEAARPLLKGREAAMLTGAATALGVALALHAASVVSGRNSKGTSLVADLSALAGGALLRWAIVRAGRASAEDREGTLEAMKPRHGSPGWGASQD